MRERFVLDQRENILFINFAGLRIEAREQVDEFAGMVRQAYETQGRRLYAIADYEGTEIAPEIIDYYGETIKSLQDRYALKTVRYSSSGFTRSVLRYLGAAKDLESNTFATREEAVRAIQEFESRSASETGLSFWKLLDPRAGVLGKLALWWLVVLAGLAGLYFAALSSVTDPARLEVWKASLLTAIAVWVVGLITSSAVVYLAVVRPLEEMERLARRLVVGGLFEPIELTSRSEIGRLAQAINDAARQLRRDIERLSGLYHISLMMGTGTEVSKIGELLTRKIARLLGAEMCVILLYDERLNCMYAQMPAHGVEDERLSQLRTGMDERSIATWVYKTGEPYITNDASNDTVISRKAADLLGVRAMLAVPIQAGEQTLGTLEVINKEGGFLEEDKRLVTIFASQAAHLLVSAQLFEKVRDSEERHRQIFESALDGLFRCTLDGRLVTVNPALAGMLGYDGPDELTGANLFSDLFAEEEAGARLFDHLAAQGQALDVECDLRRKCGGAMPARLSIRVVSDNAGKEPYHLGTVKDVTEQKKLSEQLIISERLAVVGELVAGVAHEVRNPLFGITTTLSALERKLEDREALKPFLKVVMAEVDRLNHLMEQLLEHSRPIRLDSRSIDIRDLIREVIDEFGSQPLVRGIDVSIDCDGPVPGLHLDRRKMHGVFANLIDNALQHTQQGGRIQVVIRSMPELAAVRLEVKDTGAGVAAEDLGKIFEPFFTTRVTGTGLGLAIVRKTIHDHGGTIAVDSAPGKGTSFSITLPLRN